jgi:hypothetical protein
MSIEYITKEFYNEVPKGTIFIPTDQTEKEFMIHKQLMINFQDFDNLRIKILNLN